MIHKKRISGIEIIGKNCERCEEKGSKQGTLNTRISNLEKCLEFEQKINFSEQDIEVITYPINENSPCSAHLLLKKEYENMRHMIISVPSKNENDINFRCLRISSPIDININPGNFVNYTKMLTKSYDGHDIEDDTHNNRVSELAFYLIQRLENLFFKSDIVENKKLEKKFKIKYPQINFEDEYMYLKNMLLSAKDRSIREFKKEYQYEIKSMAMMHDIGKFLIPTQILNAPRGLSRDEFDIVKKHTSYGQKILCGIKGLELASSMVKYHHEKYNGEGYYRLHGVEIPLGSQIIAPVDIYDALASRRPYREELDPNSILEMTRGNYSNIHRDNFLGHFNPILDTFMFETIYSDIIDYHKMLKNVYLE